jgi:hypothetical protein
MTSRRHWPAIATGRNRMSRLEGNRTLQRGRLCLMGALDEPFGDRWLVGLSHNGPKPSPGPFGPNATRARPKIAVNGRYHPITSMGSRPVPRYDAHTAGPGSTSRRPLTKR